MLHSGAMELIGSILDQVKPEHDRRHRDHRAPDLLAVQASSAGPARSAWSSVSASSSWSTRLAVAFDLRLLTQILQTGAVVGLFALVVIFQPELRRALERIGRVGSFGVAPVAGRIARRRARLDRGRPGGGRAVGRRPGRPDRAPARDRPRGGRRDRGDDPRRRLGRPAAHDLHAQVAAPRRRGHHPRRSDRRGRSAPAAGRDIDPHGAVRDAPSGGPRHHRADRRGRRRRLRGERPDQPRRTRPDRPQPDRGRAGPRRSRDCSIRPAAVGARSAGGPPAQAGGLGGRSPRLRELGRFVGRSPASGKPQATIAQATAVPAATAPRPRLQPRPRHRRHRATAVPTSAPASATTPAAPTPTTDGATPAPAATRSPTRKQGAGQPQPKPPAPTSGEADVVAPAAARAPR